MKKCLMSIFVLFVAAVVFAQEDAVVSEMKEESAAVEAPSRSALSVELKIGTAVEDREIVGEAEVFDSAAITRIYCWSRVTGAPEGAAITHKWYLGDKLISEIPLNIKGSPFRTWSYKTIMPEFKGAWKVEAVDSDGVVIGFKTFNIGSGLNY